MHQLLASNPEVIVSGTVEKQGRFHDRFEHVVFLSAPPRVLVELDGQRSTPELADVVGRPLLGRTAAR
jgi:hypothetical protein